MHGFRAIVARTNELPENGLSKLYVRVRVLKLIYHLLLATGCYKKDYVYR